MPAKKATTLTLAATADRYFEMREKRLAMQKEVDKVEAEEKALRDYLITNIPAAGASGISGKLVQVEVVEKEVPAAESPESWPDIIAWIARNKAWDMLQKKLNTKATRDRIDAGKRIPGVILQGVRELSIHRLK